MTSEASGTFDLVIERHIAAPRASVWAAWVDPVLLAKWFCPRPWVAEIKALDMRPGGAFETVMHGPEGEDFGGPGIFLEVIPQEKLVFTSALAEGWRPVSASLAMTAVITMTDEANGCLYRAHVLHADAEACSRHEEMGFHEGWGKCIDQLEEVAKELNRDGQ